LILDEPKSNLDEQGERQLALSIGQLKARGCTVIVITHRTLLLGIVDKMLVLQGGLTGLYGPRDEVLAKLKEQPRPEAATAANQMAIKRNESA
jgi:ATP-binding cassette subfamily C exporter for protease/lipase